MTKYDKILLIRFGGWRVSYIIYIYVRTYVRIIMNIYAQVNGTKQQRKTKLISIVDSISLNIPFRFLSVDTPLAHKKMVKLSLRVLEIEHALISYSTFLCVYYIY